MTCRSMHEQGMWTDTSVCHPHTSPCGEKGEPGKEPGGSARALAPGVFDKKVQRESTAFCHPCPGNVPYTVQVPGRRIFPASWRGARNITLEPRLGPQKSADGDWLKVRGHILRLSRKGGLMVWNAGQGKVSCPCVPAGSRRGALTAAKPGSTALTFLHSGQAQSTKCELCPNLGST